MGLETSANFPSFATDASPESLRMEETMIRQDDAAEYTNSLPLTIIVDGEGKRWEVPARPAGSGALPPIAEPWGLEVVDSDSATVKISNPGILKQTSAVDESGDVAITGIGSSYNVAVGDYLILKLTGLVGTVAASIEMASTWDGYPDTFQLVDNGEAEGWQMEQANFPIWFFMVPDVNRSDLVSINENVAAKKMMRGFSDIQPRQILWENSAGKAAVVLDLFNAVGSNG